MKKLMTWLGILSVLGGLCPVRGQTLFSDDFDADTSASWVLFDDSGDGISDYTAEFGFDYSTTRYISNGLTNNIPPAPNSAGGSAKGLKLTVNNNDDTPARAAVSLYPRDQRFSGQFALRFDMWINYNGPAFGGTGSTEFGTFGINHPGDKANWEFGAVSDGVWFAVDGEAGTGTAGDYRAFVGDNASTAVPVIGSDAFLDRDADGVPEFNVTGAQPSSYPLKQMFPNPPFETPGAPGKQWVQVEVRQRTDTQGAVLVTWLINGYVIAEHPFGSQLGLTEGNIMLGYMDTFNSLADPRADNFIIFDNVRVVNLETEPVLAVVTVSTTDAEAAEPGSNTGTIEFTRTGDTSQALTVRFRAGGTAQAGSDYQNPGDSIVIPAGAASATLSIVPINDQIAEPTENVEVVLVGGAGYEIREAISGSVEIADDNDGTPTVTLTTVRPAAYEFIPARVGQFSVSLLSAPAAPVTVSYTIGGTAVNGTDYATIENNVTVPAGETNAAITIVPVNNNVIDGNRTVLLTLTPGNYVIGSPSNGTVTIRDDDLPAGTLLFAETFDTDTTASWIVNQAHEGESQATFFYDYSADGIPPAPNSAGGTTRGVKLEANIGLGTFTGLSVSPAGQSFSGDYRLRFDMWINYNGPLDGGGTGSTFVQSAGVGTSGTRPQWAGGTQDSVWFGATGDGGSSVDYRAYSAAAGTGYLPDSGVFAAGTHGTARNQTDPYYAEFGRESAPPAQLNIQPEQTDETLPGAAGMAWRDVVITKHGTQATFDIDGLRIATVDISALALSDNIFLGYFDINDSQTGNPAMSFGLADNVRVEAIGMAIEPPRITGVRRSGGNLAIEFDAPGATQSQLGLQSTSSLSGAIAWQDVSGATIESLGGGRYRVTIPLPNEPARFYRIAAR